MKKINSQQTVRWLSKVSKIFIKDISESQTRPYSIYFNLLNFQDTENLSKWLTTEFVTDTSFIQYRANSNNIEFTFKTYQEFESLLLKYYEKYPDSLLNLCYRKQRIVPQDTKWSVQLLYLREKVLMMEYFRHSLHQFESKTTDNFPIPTKALLLKKIKPKASQLVRIPSSSRRSKSKSPSPSRRSKSKSPSPSRRSKSKSPSPSRRSKSKSPSRHSKSKSPSRHSKSKSPSRRSKSKSPSRHSKSKSLSRRSKSKSLSRHSKSKSLSRRSKSPSQSKSPSVLSNSNMSNFLNKIESSDNTSFFDKSSNISTTSPKSSSPKSSSVLKDKSHKSDYMDNLENQLLNARLSPILKESVELFN